MEGLNNGNEGRWLVALEGLGEDERGRIMARMQRRRYGKRVLVFNYGDPADAALVIESGRVRHFHSNPEGAEFTIEVGSAARTLGLISAVLGSRRLTSVQTVEETQVLALPRDDLLELMQLIPRFGLNVAKVVAGIAGECLTAWSPMALEPAPLRLARALRKLGTASPDQPRTVVVRGLTQDDVASVVGVSRPWVSLTLSDFEKQGLIWRRRNEIGIHDTGALERYCRGASAEGGSG